MISAMSEEILKGVQFLLSKWESKEIPADVVLALIEVHLEREKELTPMPTKGQDHKEFLYWEKHLPELIEEFREIMPDSPGLEVMEEGINFMTELAGKYISLLE